MNELQLINVLLGIGASLASIIGAIRLKGSAGTIRWLSDRLGADLYELSGGFDTALERESPARLLRGLGEMANDDDFSGLEVSDLVTLASNNASPSMLIESALLGEDIDRAELLGGHLTDEELRSILDDRKLWPDPIEEVAEMEDAPGNAYAWILSEEATEEDRVSLAKEIEDTFVELNRSEPDAMHFIVTGVDELRELDSETVENYVKPWLKDSTTSEEGGNR